MSSSQLIWFLLIDSDSGLPYKGTSAENVSVACSADISDFRKAVKDKLSDELSSVDAADLFVYNNKAASDNIYAAAVDERIEVPLEEDFLVYGLGMAKNEALIVIVPSSIANNNVNITETFNVDLAIKDLALEIREIRRNLTLEMQTIRDLALQISETSRNLAFQISESRKDLMLQPNEDARDLACFSETNKDLRLEMRGAIRDLALEINQRYYEVSEKDNNEQL